MFRSKWFYTLIISIFILMGRPSLLCAQKNLLAVFNLRATNIEAMGYNGDILYVLNTSLGKEEAISLLPRREMEEVLLRHGLAQSDNPETVLKAGKALDIDFILFGQVTKESDNILADLKLMDIIQGRVISTWSLTFSRREAISEKIPSFVKEVITAVSSQKIEPASPAPAPTLESKIVIENLRTHCSDDKVTIQWEFDASQPISSFHIYRSKKEKGPYQFLTKSDTNIFVDSDIKKGEFYYYRIGILADSGKEIRSEQTVQVRYAAENSPHPPLIVGAKGGIGRVEIKFVPSLQNTQGGFKIIQYKIYRKKATNNSWEHTADIDVKKDTQLTFTYKDTKDIEDGQALNYAVSCLDKENLESPLSGPVSVKSLKPPTLKVEKDNLLKKINLAWEPMENVTGYSIFRKSDTEEWKKIDKVKGAEKYYYTDDNDLEDGKKFYYYITAYDKEAETGQSNTVQAKTKDLPPPPENLKAQSHMVQSALLSWTPLDDQDIGGYAIYRGTEPARLELITVVKKNTTGSYLDKGTKSSPLEDGTLYYYAIASYSTFKAQGTTSAAAQAQTKPKPTLVSNLKVRAQEDTIYLSWDKNPEPDIKGYIIYKSRNGKKWKELQEMPADLNSYNDKDLRPEDSYTYRLIAEDKDGLMSEPADSSPILSQVTTALRMVKDNQLRQIDLAWLPLQNIKGYYLYRKSETEDWEKVAKVKGAKKSGHSDKKDLLDGKTYSYYLTTYDEEGETSPSNEVTGKTKDLPPIPQNLQAESNLVKAVSVSWSSINDPDIGGYTIYRRTGATNLEQIDQVKGYESNSYKDKGAMFKSLEDGTEYYYAIRCFNLFKAEGELTQEVKAKTKSRPQPVQEFVVRVNGEQLLVSWSKNPEPDIKNYILYRNKNGGSWSKIKKLEPEETTYTDNNLKPEISYGYKIIVEDLDRLKSDPVESNTLKSPLVKSK